MTPLSLHCARVHCNAALSCDMLKKIKLHTPFFPSSLLCQEENIVTDYLEHPLDRKLLQ